MISVRRGSRQPNPLEIYELTIGDEIYADKFLPIKWALHNRSSIITNVAAAI